MLPKLVRTYERRLNFNFWKKWDKEKALRVVNFVKDFLNEIFPLQKTSWKEISKIQIEENKLVLFSGSRKDLLKNNNLHIDILIDSKTTVGEIDKANISDVIVESALSTIVDNEDSVAAVDAEDKVKCYRNWLGLMKGDLTSTFEKNGIKKKH